MPDIKPKKTSSRFTSTDIEKAINCLKRNKNPGIDELTKGMLQYSAEDTTEEIVTRLSEIVQTREFPEEIRTGILAPLPKPGKKKGPPKGPSNLRPVTSLSIFLNILATYLLNSLS